MWIMKNYMTDESTAISIGQRMKDEVNIMMLLCSFLHFPACFAKSYDYALSATH